MHGSGIRIGNRLFHSVMISAYCVVYENKHSLYSSLPRQVAVLSCDSWIQIQHAQDNAISLVHLQKVEMNFCHSSNKEYFRRSLALHQSSSPGSLMPLTTLAKLGLCGINDSMALIKPKPCALKD